MVTRNRNRRDWPPTRVLSEGIKLARPFQNVPVRAKIGESDKATVRLPGSHTMVCTYTDSGKYLVGIATDYRIPDLGAQATRFLEWHESPGAARDQVAGLIKRYFPRRIRFHWFSTGSSGTLRVCTEVWDPWSQDWDMYIGPLPLTGDPYGYIPADADYTDPEPYQQAENTALVKVGLTRSDITDEPVEAW